MCAWMHAVTDITLFPAHRATAHPTDYLYAFKTPLSARLWRLQTPAHTARSANHLTSTLFCSLPPPSLYVLSWYSNVLLQRPPPSLPSIATAGCPTQVPVREGPWHLEDGTVPRTIGRAQVRAWNVELASEHRRLRVLVDQGRGQLLQLGGVPPLGCISKAMECIRRLR